MLTGTLDFCNEVIQPVIGSAWNNTFVHVQKQDLSNYSTLCLIAVSLVTFNFLALPLLPTSKQIEQYKQERE